MEARHVRAKQDRQGRWLAYRDDYPMLQDTKPARFATCAMRNEPPTLLTVVSKALLTLPRVESIAADLNEIRDQNAKLSVQRDTRFDLLEQLEPARLIELGDELYPLWLRRRDYDAVDRRLRLHFDNVGGDLSKQVDQANYLWESLAIGPPDDAGPLCHRGDNCARRECRSSTLLKAASVQRVVHRHHGAVDAHQRNAAGRIL